MFFPVETAAVGPEPNPPGVPDRPEAERIRRAHREQQPEPLAGCVGAGVADGERVHLAARVASDQVERAFEDRPVGGLGRPGEGPGGPGLRMGRAEEPAFDPGAEPVDGLIDQAGCDEGVRQRTSDEL